MMMVEVEDEVEVAALAAPAGGLGTAWMHANSGKRVFGDFGEAVATVLIVEMAVDWWVRAWQDVETTTACIAEEYMLKKE